MRRTVQTLAAWIAALMGCSGDRHVASVGSNCASVQRWDMPSHERGATAVSLSACLRLPERARRTADVEFVAVLRNAGSRDAVFLTSPLGDPRFEVSPVHGPVIWSSLDGVNVIAALLAVTARAGDSITSRAVWRPGILTRPGEYVVRAILTTAHEEKSVDATFSLR